MKSFLTGPLTLPRSDALKAIARGKPSEVLAGPQTCCLSCNVVPVPGGRPSSPPRICEGGFVLIKTNSDAGKIQKTLPTSLSWHLSFVRPPCVSVPVKGVPACGGTSSVL